ncbi:MAG: hypothetical protein CO158_03760 [Piscirickettsiaceae bacterium CG_4_9_14_3_um_filter_43_564]|nr:MAG: hypothetical protein COW74_11325 [Piscirickettsiaceae bacterium CG18_big_fil_WC_8_21_14_2_50_44_103]PIU37642.1 MAG: hypothetical protein COT01_10780 [Piscirickettsiaceae bacterium CG07_land_8_20_14_0_80_44_28]PIW57999.1 MAG: hypothetical protein COW14_03100 [Piscirickettsiaceae bacterium CG12_big_fil_rev_8_21_14_0_65_44_934]PIW76711.1 MAG: hypothetical protein CO000_10790 [Piscirickettsiaceae bacterium CG_4_8_14_3_um_filter_44_38]PIX79090.1 MAG: hypothetical protein COZ36_06060 [Pisciri
MRVIYRGIIHFMILVGISGSAYAATQPYIGVGAIKSLKTKTPSSQIGEQIKLGLKFNAYLSVELAAQSLGQHRYTNSTDTKDNFTVAGYGFGVQVKPFSYLNLLAQPYMTVSFNTILTNIYEQGDVLGSPTIREGSSMASGTIGIETIVFEPGLSLFSEVSQMADNSLQSPFVHVAIGLNYHF